MEKELTTAAGAAVPENQEQNILPEAKCPVTGGSRRHTWQGPRRMRAGGRIS